MKPQQIALQISSSLNVSLDLSQWLAIIRFLESDSLIMLTGETDQVWHMAIQLDFYDATCLYFLGRKVTHGEVTAFEEIDVINTIRLLEKAYGKDLHQNLKIWRDMYNSGYWDVCCVIKGEI